MDDLSDDQPHYHVSPWEGVAILGGAVLLVAAGLAGLGVKALGNAFNPQRAEAIARSLMSYEVPSGSYGFFGTNIGGGKMAVVVSKATVAPAQSNQQAPAIELFLARMPLEEAEPEAEAPVQQQTQNELFSGFSFSYQDPAAFQIQQDETEKQLFCGAVVPVEVQRGNLTIASDAAPLPAVKYEVKRVLDGENHIVIVSALGNAAAQQVNQVFDSLDCK